MNGDQMLSAAWWGGVMPVFAQMAELDPREMERGGTRMLLYLAGIALLLIAAFVVVIVLFSYGKLWLQAVMSNAHVSLFSLIGMSLRQVHARTIVEAKIMAMQAGVGTDPDTGITTRRLEAHYLAGGNVPRVIHALIAAHRADIDLDFDRAAAIDLAGRDVLDAVRTSVYPKVIDCPDPEKSGRHDAERRGEERRRAVGASAGHGAHEPRRSSSAGRPRRRSSPASARASSRRSARPKIICK